MKKICAEILNENLPQDSWGINKIKAIMNLMKNES